MESRISHLHKIFYSARYTYFCVGLSVYFAIIVSKKMQKSSAIQNNSITLSSVHYS